MSTTTTTLAERTRRGAVGGAKLAIRSWGCLTAPARPLPDFLVIGTKRGGTTSLWNWLLQHPDVLPQLPSRQNIKSPHYFYWHFDRGESWYRSHFATSMSRARARRHAGGARVVTGEASPYYLFDPRVPARVADVLPQVRLIVLLRNPVDRAASHHRERTNAGVEKLSFADALDAEQGRLAGESERMSADPFYYSRAHDWYSYRSRGIYAPQLQAWRACFPDDQILVVQSEHLYADPGKSFDEVTDFLGLRRHEGLRADHHNYRPRAAMDEHVRAELADFYREPNEQLFADLGRRFDWE